MSNTDKRDKVNIIVLPHLNMFHFCGLGLAGIGNDAWYCYGNEDLLFHHVERNLKLAGKAHNVTSIEFLRECGKSQDYSVMFNAVEQA